MVFARSGHPVLAGSQLTVPELNGPGGRDPPQPRARLATTTEAATADGVRQLLRRSRGYDGWWPLRCRRPRKRPRAVETDMQTSDRL